MLIIKKRSLNVVLLILLIFSTGSAYHIIWGQILSPLAYFILFICYCCFVNSIKNKLFYVSVFSLSFVLLFVSINYLIVPFDSDKWLYCKTILRLIFVLLLYIYYESSKSNFIDDLYIALKIIAIHSLVGFICGFFLLPYLVQFSDLLQIQTFGNIFFYQSVTSVFDYHIFRSQGFFWEPGILVGYLSLLLFLSTYIRKNVKYQVLSVFLIITTFSTTGLILLVIQILFIFLDLKKQKNLRYYFSLLIIISMSIPIIYFTTININEKFSGSGIHSSQLRIYDLYQAINLIGTYPISGIGMDPKIYLALSEANTNIFESEWLTDSIREMRGNTNDVLMIFVKLGIPLGILFYYFLFRGLIITEKKFLLLIIIIIINLSEPLTLGNFYLYFFMSGVCSLFGASAESWVPSHGVN